MPRGFVVPSLLWAMGVSTKLQTQRNNPRCHSPARVGCGSHSSQRHAKAVKKISPALWQCERRAKLSSAPSMSLAKKSLRPSGPWSRAQASTTPRGEAFRHPRNSSIVKLQGLCLLPEQNPCSEKIRYHYIQDENDTGCSRMIWRGCPKRIMSTATMLRWR
jgi:hypothetical protein